MGIGWFRALIEAAPDVYFRFALVRPRGFVYLSPAVQKLTGRRAADFCSRPSLFSEIVPLEERTLLRHIARGRSARACTMRVRHLDGTVLVLDIRTVPVLRGRRLVAVEGVARLQAASDAACMQPEPTQQRLASLLYEVHDLLHRALPSRNGHVASICPGTALRIGDVTLDSDHMTVTCGADRVTLTTREFLVLKYLGQRPGRIVTRAQLLSDVWGYQYQGDDRTVDVHISRLRRKLPSIAHRLVAVRHVGYRLDLDDLDAPAARTAS